MQCWDIRIGTAKKSALCRRDHNSGMERYLFGITNMGLMDEESTALAQASGLKAIQSICNPVLDWQVYVYAMHIYRICCDQISVLVLLAKHAF